MNKIKKKKLLIIIIIAATVLIAALVIPMIFSDYDITEQIAMKKGNLTKYSYSSGGDMLGSHYSETVKDYDGTRAVLTITSAEYHSAPEEINEYFISSEVLKELNSVFRKHHMNRWEHRKIGKMFIADGASYSYSFYFGDASCSFSSQYYPGLYRKGVDALSEIIDKYSENKERIPGLVTEPPEKDENDYYYYPVPEKDKLTFEVFKYCEQTVYFRLLNGKDENAKITNSYEIINCDTNESVPVENSSYIYERDVDSGEIFDDYIKVCDLLEAGHYILKADDYSAEFEIK